MRIAISADGLGLDARVAHRFGMSPYLVFLDPITMEYEAVPNPGATGGRGAGLQATALAIGREVQAVITGYCSPRTEKYLTSYGILVLTGMDTTVLDAAKSYLDRVERRDQDAEEDSRYYTHVPARTVVIHTVKSTAKQCAGLLPMLMGVVFLMGLFTTFVSKAPASSIFSGHVAMDSLWGACIGSILAGNPINSYIVGGELLHSGVSLFAVTALIVAWVSVGLVQLPAEIAALGTRFGLTRTLLSFLGAITIAVMTVVVFNGVVGLLR